MIKVDNSQNLKFKSVLNKSIWKSTNIYCYFTTEKYLVPAIKR